MMSFRENILAAALKVAEFVTFCEISDLIPATNVLNNLLDLREQVLAVKSVKPPTS
jgi:hypothetical protein